MFELLLNFHENETNSVDKDIFIFGESGQEVSVRNDEGFDETVTIDTDGFALVNLPDSQAMSGTSINNLGFQIVSDAPIQAYFSNRAPFTTDLTIIFEKASLGTEYLLASVGGDVPGTGFGERGQFSVQATEDDTTVDVTLSDGQTFSVDINAGETFKFATNPTDVDANNSLGISIPFDFDLTGTLVRTSAPAAVFSGHECTQIGAAACDHLVEQMPPISALSSSYVVGEAKNVGSGDNFVRVIAAEDNTEVTVDGTVVTTLSAQESYDFTLSNAAAIIETSKPTLVAQFLQSQNLVGEGDPAMMFVPGRDSWLSEYRLANPAGSAAFDQNLVNIIIPTSALDSLTLNGVAVDTESFTPIGSSDLSVANLAVNVGLFTLEASENFQVSLFGYESFDSYLTFGAADFAVGLSPVPPVAVDDAFATDEDTAFTTEDVLDNDTDANADTITVVDVDTDGTAGLVTDNGDGTFDYDPNSQYESLADGDSATDTFLYTITDGNDGSDAATVTVTIEGVNDAPVVTVPVADQIATQDSSFSLTLPSGTFTDIDQGDSLTIAAGDLPDWLSYDEASQTFSGTPGADDVGTVDVTVTATDTAGESISDTFSLEVSSVEDPNRPPTANADEVTTNEDTEIKIAAATLLANDTDPDGDTLTITAVDDEDTTGTVSLSDESVNYDPNSQYESLADGDSATDTFSYTVTDGNGGSDTASVEITIEGVNDAPVVTVPVADQIATQDSSFSLTLPSGTFTDIDQGDSLTIAAGDLPDWLSYDEASQTFSGTPGADDVGTVDVTVTATDTAGESISDTFSLEVSSVEDPNRPPTANADEVTTNEDTGITIAAATLLANDTDPDGDTLTITAVDDEGTTGTVSLSGGSVVYSPSAGFSGQDSFTYEISDGELTDSATVVVDVNSSTEPSLSVTKLVDANGDSTFTAQEVEANSGQVTFQVEVVNTSDVAITISGVVDSAFDEAVLIDQLVGQTLAAGESTVATYVPTLSREDATILGTTGIDTLSAEQFLVTNEVSVSGTTDDGLTATASSIAETLVDANSLIAGDLDEDTILGGAGDDVLRGDLNLRSSQVGIGNDDVIFGGAGRDRIGGKGGNDMLFGGDGDDRIWGDDGDDFLRGGLGNDQLVGDDFSGGSGSDTFVLAAGEGTDTILDFETGVDLIGLADGLSLGALTFEGNSILFEEETLAILQGVDTTSLDGSSFLTV